MYYLVPGFKTFLIKKKLFMLEILFDKRFDALI